MSGEWWVVCGGEWWAVSGEEWWVMGGGVVVVVWCGSG